jgi:electron transfer flavoprotein beta subunit
MMIATMLNMPIVSVVTKIDWQDNTNIVVQREIENGHEEVKLTLPAMLTTQKGLNEPRYASLKGIMKAKRKPIDTQEIALEKSYVEVTKLTYPPARPPGKIVGEGVEAVPELVRLLREEAKVL